MPKLTVLATCLVAMLLSYPASAQEDEQRPPTIFLTSWMCDRSALDEIQNEQRERNLPILQDLVNQGQIWSASSMVHDWGDEWNYVTAYLADDIASGAAANSELRRRYDEEYADSILLEQCRTHRDNIYIGAFTTGNVDPDPEPPYTIAMSYFACPISELGSIADMGREHILPAVQASIEAGEGYWAGGAVHAWGDEWNFLLVRSAEDLPSLVRFAEDTDNRMGENAREVTETCWAHKDNIYSVVMETTPAME